MNRSLLSQLPDILASAVRRSVALLHAAERAAYAVNASKPGGALPRLAVGAAVRGSAFNRWRFLGQSDAAAMLTLIVGSSVEPGMRHRFSLLWLSPQPKNMAMSANLDDRDALADRAFTNGPSHSMDPDHRVLSDLALRLLLANKLAAPGALLVVAPPPALKDCAILLMQAIVGHPPVAFRLDSGAEIETVWVGVTTLQGAPAPQWLSRMKGKSMAHCLQHSGATDHMALALSPPKSVLATMAAWKGPWTVTHPDPLALALLREAVTLGHWQPPLPSPPMSAREMCPPRAYLIAA